MSMYTVPCEFCGSMTPHPVTIKGVHFCSAGHYRAFYRLNAPPYGHKGKVHRIHMENGEHFDMKPSYEEK